jgi:SMI1 / KNR4 family (SUKH-1)
MSYRSRRFKPNPPASEKAISELMAALSKPLPSSFVAFFKRANGGEGFVGTRYVQLWRVEDLIELNNGYKVNEFAPRLFLIGSDGGGEAYAFDLSSDDSAVLEIPFIPLDRHESRQIVESFDSFVAGIKL